jgi:hypothetical protein
VRLLDPESAPPPGLSREDCLVAFFRVALGELVQQHFFRVRPAIEVAGLEAIAQGFGPNVEAVVGRAFLAAGARSVVFESGARVVRRRSGWWSWLIGGGRS